MKATGLLLRHSLVQMNSADGTLSIHRLIQLAYLQKLGKEERAEAFRAVVELLWYVHPKQELGCPMEKMWPQCRLYMNHVQTLGNHWQDFGNAETGLEKLAEIIFNCSW